MEYRFVDSSNKTIVDDVKRERAFLAEQAALEAETNYGLNPQDDRWQEIVKNSRKVAAERTAKAGIQFKELLAFRIKWFEDWISRVEESHVKNAINIELAEEEGDENLQQYLSNQKNMEIAHDYALTKLSELKNGQMKKSKGVKKNVQSKS